jgi:hypothetical protein
MLVLAPIMFALYLFGGVPFEIRVFYEMYSVLILLVSPTIGQLIGLKFFEEQLECSSSL